MFYICKYVRLLILLAVTELNPDKYFQLPPMPSTVHYNSLLDMFSKINFKFYSTTGVILWCKFIYFII